jgi:hypothetical protein
MFNVLLDTSIWLQFAGDTRHLELFEALKWMMEEGQVRLLVPHIVVDEFRKNRHQVIERYRKGLITHLNAVRKAIRASEIGDGNDAAISEILADLDRRVVMEANTPQDGLEQIEGLMRLGVLIKTSDAVMLRAAERALSRKAPCHRNKNSIADAVLIETYFECVTKGRAGERFAFVTRNTEDFSGPRLDERLVHPDLASGFSRRRSLYFVTLEACLRRIDPVMYRQAIDPDLPFRRLRSRSEVTAARDHLTLRLRYIQYMDWVRRIEFGILRFKAAPGVDYECDHERICNELREWCEQAKPRLGPGRLEHADAFELGDLVGRSTALSWMLGLGWEEPTEWAMFNRLAGD